jgi:hypothetical protein
VVIRILLSVLANLVALGAFVLGAVAVVAGIAEQHAANNTYVVTIATSGDDCGANKVAFDVGGNLLSCANPVVPPSDTVARFPGFTDEQDQQITDLAHQIGANGSLSDAGLAEIQTQVDKFAATVPEAKKPHYDEGVSVEPLWGAWLAVVGGLAAVLGLGWITFGHRLFRAR